MILEQLTPQAYSEAFGSLALTPFGTAGFNRLNESKAEAVYYLAAFDENDRPRFGIILGELNGELRSPFSAPWGEIACSRDTSLNRIAEFFSCLKKHSPLPKHLTFPPEYIAPSLLSKLTGVALNIAAKATFNFTYHYPLELFAEFESNLSRTAGQKFRHAKRLNFKFEQCPLERAYSVIAANREAHGYPLAMSLEQMNETAAIIDIDSFVLSLDGTDTASAIVYRLNPQIAHMVYWGDIPEFSSHRPMNILPYHLFSHYHREGYSIVNIGPSSTNGIPNLGLCEFKESLGCCCSLIPSVTLI